MKIIYKINTASFEEIFMHLQQCNKNFVPCLESRIDLEVFARKIYSLAITFEAWCSSELVGFLSAYFNDPGRHAGFINHLSILEVYQRQSIAENLLNMATSYAGERDFNKILLEVDKRNFKAIRLYKKTGFVEEGSRGNVTCNKLLIKRIF
ncbi:MAG: GNAT family N-acetyltransferase [Candidatus Peribacteraceae bacterium]|nr:GNAT family N-acetyltransferase [Candidatus Peribacteraceae bacterium]